jgi:hypothetical protein
LASHAVCLRGGEQPQSTGHPLSFAGCSVEIPIAAAEQVPGYADSRAAAAWKGEAPRCNGLIQLSKGRARANGRGFRRHIDGNRIHQSQIDDHARALREPLVGVPAAAHGERHIVATAPIDHDADRVRGLAHRAQLRRQHRAGVEGRFVLRELSIAGAYEQSVARREVGQGRQRGSGTV